MLSSELIIIYLAAAAPFGVANFLYRSPNLSSPRSLLHAIGAALLWPLVLFTRPRARKNFRLRELEVPEQNVSLLRELRIDEARLMLLSVLYKTEDLARDVSNSYTEAMRQSVGGVIASVECYIGLSLAIADANEDASPREIELCRIAGREEDDDLLIAGRCHQRRNLARLKTHQAQSRLELLHALAELREVCKSIQGAFTNQHSVRQLLAALLEAYARAIDLFSLFEDERAAMQVARLLDVATASLRRSEILPAQVAPGSLAQLNRTGNVARKDEPCTTSIPHTTTPQPQLPPTPTTIRAHGCIGSTS